MGKRSVWKGPYIDGFLLKMVEKARSSTKGMVIKTKSRRSTIIPKMVGLTFAVYNGKAYVPVLVSEHMVGKKLGEFAPTRVFKGHGANRKATIGG